MEKKVVFGDIYINEKLIATIKVIGIHPCEQMGIEIATLLGLPNPEKYTGQCWRGTAATFLADHGLTEVQIMGVTGHQSTSSLQKYIENSAVQKRTAAEAFSISGSNNKENLHQNTNLKQSREVVTTVTKKSGRGNIEIILNNYSSFSGNVKVIQKDNKDDEYNDKCDEN